MGMVHANGFRINQQNEILPLAKGEIGRFKFLANKAKTGS